MTHLLRNVAIAVASTLAIGGAAFAQQTSNASAELTVAQIVQKLEALGYTKIHEIEKDHGVWEVEATSAAGTRVDLNVDPVDGRVVSEKPDTDD